jgi:hypothetical protein
MRKINISKKNHHSGHAKNFVIQSAVTSLEQIHPNNLAIVKK